MNKVELMKMTVPKLREEALKVPGIAGVHGMRKEELIQKLCEFHNIPYEEPKVRRDNTALKRKIKELRAKKEQAQTAKDKKKTKILQVKIKRIKRKTRRA